MSPMAARRLCAGSPTCPNTVMRTASRCPEHTRQREQRRGSAYQRGYDAAWNRLRVFYLARHPLCQRCEAKGLVVTAREVHHRVPIAVDPSQRLVTSNLEALCKRCHTAETFGARRGFAIGKGIPR
jgi:5-methylcytosine-specific restriction protein A